MGEELNVADKASAKILAAHNDAITAIKKMQGFSVPQGVQPKETEDALHNLIKLYREVNPVLIPMQSDVLREVTYVTDQTLHLCTSHFQGPHPTRIARTDETTLRLSQNLMRARLEAERVLAPIIAVSNAFSSVTSIAKSETQKTVDKAAQQFQSFTQDVRNEAQSVRATVEMARQEWEEKTEQLNKDIGKVGVAKYAAFFQEQADMHDTGMRRWLFASIAAAAVLAGTLFASFFYLDFAEGQSANIQFAATKALFFSTLAYALFFCVKNCMAHRHNYVINKHRQNALSTYRAIVGATDTKGSAHDIVLAQAAYCIFAPQSTGYAKDGGGEKINLSGALTARD